MSNNNVNAELANLARQLKEMEAENAKLKMQAQHASRISLKVSDKGAVSLYGMGKFPVTLYKEQWERVLANAENITKFLAENASKLAVKSPATPTAKPASGPAVSPAVPSPAKAF